MQICHLVCLAAMQLISSANTVYIQREYSEPSGLTIPSFMRLDILTTTRLATRLEDEGLGHGYD